MSQLFNQTKNEILAEDVIIADNFISRAKGLLGKKSFSPKKTLWIKNCNDIHTYFMKFPIDVVFVDKKLVVTKVVLSLSPWRVVFNFKAKSVFEFKGGSLSKASIEVGDYLNVNS